MTLHLLSARSRPATSRRRPSGSRSRTMFCEGLEDRLVLSSATPGFALSLDLVNHVAIQPAPQVHLTTAAPKVVTPVKATTPTTTVKATTPTTTVKATTPTTTVKATTPTTTVKATTPTTTVKATTPTTTVKTAATTTTTTTTTTTPAATTLVTLNLNPLDVNLLGLQVQTSAITVTVAAQPGSGELLGNLLSDVSGLLNLQGVNTALNTVLSNVVTLANEAALSVSGVTGNGSVPAPAPATVPVLNLHVAPVNLNLLGAVVTTSPINLTITAHSGGSNDLLGNVVADLANLLNGQSNQSLSINSINTDLANLLKELKASLPSSILSTIPAPAAPTTPTAGESQVLALTVPPINLDLLGLMLQTQQIQVNVDAQSGNGDLLGNLLDQVLNTLGATPANISTLNTNLNALLGEVIGVLNASTLTLPANALSSLSPVIQSLASPTLVNTSSTPATAQVLNLDIAALPTDTQPPVDVNLLGLVVTTNNIEAQLNATTGNGQILGNLVYNVSHLLDPNGSVGLLSILSSLGV